MRENVWKKNLKKKQPTLITTLPGTPSTRLTTLPETPSTRLTTLPGTPSLPSSWPPLLG